MNNEVETVQVEAPNDSKSFIVINQTDFDPKQHRIFNPVVPAKVDESGDATGLDKFTVTELREIAAQRGIELKGNLAKAAIIELLESKN